MQHVEDNNQNIVSVTGRIRNIIWEGKAIIAANNMADFFIFIQLYLDGENTYPILPYLFQQWSNLKLIINMVLRLFLSISAKSINFKCFKCENIVSRLLKLSWWLYWDINPTRTRKEIWWVNVLRFVRRSTILESKAELLEKVVKRSHHKGKVYYVNY